MFISQGTIVEAKVVDGSLQLTSENCDQYITKFSFSPSVEGHIRGFIHLAQPNQQNYYSGMNHRLKLSLFDDAGFQRYLKMLKEGSLCVERMQNAIAEYHLHPTLPPLKRRTDDSSFVAQLADRPRTHYVFAVISDCALEEFNAKPPALTYQFAFLNGKDHLPADETGMITAHVILTIVLVVFLAIYIKARCTSFPINNLSIPFPAL